VDADINEPAFTRRVPGTVIYVRPGDRLRIYVKNADIVPHSFHLHGLKYGIDSDGSWPLGTQSSDGRRSDEICPGQKWTYTFDATEATIGAWPFHDHCRDIGTYINRGLFGAIAVLRRRDHDDDLPCFDLPEGLVKLLKKHEEKKDDGGGDHGHGGMHGGMRMTAVRMTHAAMGPAAAMEMPGMPGMGGAGVPAFMLPRHAHGPDLSDVPEPFRPFIVLLDEIAHVPRREVSSKRRKTHLEMHMMSGLAGLVRSHQAVWLTPHDKARVEAETGLPLDPGPADLGAAITRLPSSCRTAASSSVAIRTDRRHRTNGICRRTSSSLGQPSRRRRPPSPMGGTSTSRVQRQDRLPKSC
jgi:hypothetical protein